MFFRQSPFISLSMLVVNLDFKVLVAVDVVPKFLIPAVQCIILRSYLVAKSTSGLINLQYLEIPSYQAL